MAIGAGPPHVAHSNCSVVNHGFREISVRSTGRRVQLPRQAPPSGEVPEPRRAAYPRPPAVFMHPHAVRRPSGSLLPRGLFHVREPHGLRIASYSEPCDAVTLPSRPDPCQGWQQGDFARRFEVRGGAVQPAPTQDRQLPSSTCYGSVSSLNPHYVDGMRCPERGTELKGGLPVGPRRRLAIELMGGRVVLGRYSR